MTAGRIPKENLKLGTVHCWKGSQDIRYQALVGLMVAGAEHSLLIDITYDSYRGQSSGSVERWSGSEWKKLYRLEGGALRGYNKGLTARREQPQPADFAADSDFLLARAWEVLAGQF